MSDNIFLSFSVLAGGENTILANMSHVVNKSFINMTSLSAAESVCSMYVIPAICIFGVVCNILNVIVLTRKHMTESPYTYLMGLALADLGLLVLAFVGTALSTRLGDGVYFWKVYDGFIFYPFANVFANSSVWVTVLLTVERFISVQFPLRAKDLCTRSIARRSIVCIILIAIFINIPRFFCQNIIEKPAGSGKFVLQSSDFEMSQFYQVVTWLYIIVIHLIPLIIISSLNCCLICALYKAQRHRHILQEPFLKSTLVLQNSREQRRLTVTCIAIIILFLICIIPSAFSNRPVAMLLFSRGRSLLQFTNSLFYRVLKAVTNMLVVMNSSLNFIMYCVFNHKFVITLRYLFRRWIGRLFPAIVRAQTDEQTIRLSKLSTSSPPPSASNVRQVMVCSSPFVDKLRHPPEMHPIRVDQNNETSPVSSLQPFTPRTRPKEEFFA